MTMLLRLRAALRPALAALVLAAATAAAAQSPLAPAPLLRAMVVVDRDIVTAGDLVEGAGPLADRPVFRAPDLGRSGTVGAEAVEAALRGAGLGAVDRAGILSVTVTRRSRPVAGEELTALVRSGLVAALGAPEDRIEIAFDQLPGAAHAAPASLTPVVLRALSVAAGRFEAVLEIDQGHSAERIRLAGRAGIVTEIVAPVRPLARGDTVGAGDLEIRRVPGRTGTAARLPDMAALVGQVARRALPAGAAVAEGDFAPQRLVRRGDIVTLTYRTERLTISASARALADGGAGDPVSVVNLRSDRIVQARVTGSGAVEVVARNGSLAARVTP